MSMRFDMMSCLQEFSVIDILIPRIQAASSAGHTDHITLDNTLPGSQYLAPSYDLRKDKNADSTKKSKARFRKNCLFQKFTRNSFAMTISSGTLKVKRHPAKADKKGRRFFVCKSCLIRTKLNSGYEIPVIGYGTFGGPSAPEQVYEGSKIALEVGYRHFDTAYVCKFCRKRR